MNSGNLRVRNAAAPGKTWLSWVMMVEAVSQILLESRETFDFVPDMVRAHLPSAIPNLKIVRKCGKVSNAYGTKPFPPKPDEALSRALVNLARHTQTEQQYEI